MPKFRIHASYLVFLQADIEALDLETAEECATALDGADFAELPHSENWRIDAVTPIADGAYAPTFAPTSLATPRHFAIERQLLIKGDRQSSRRTDRRSRS